MDKGKRREAWKASCSYHYWRGPLNHRMVNFPFNCCAFSLLELMICIETAFYRNKQYLFVTWFIIFLSHTGWNHVKAVKLINSLYMDWILLPLSLVWKSYIRFLVRLHVCEHTCNINFWSEKFDLFAIIIINVWGCNTTLDWQVKTTYSWCGLSGRKSVYKPNLTGVSSLTSPDPWGGGTVELADGPRTPAQQVQEVLKLLTLSLSLVISQPFKLV